MDNNNGSNTNDILKILEEYRNKNKTDKKAPEKTVAEKQPEPKAAVVPDAEDDDVKVVQDVPAEEKPAEELPLNFSHFTDEADLTSIPESKKQNHFAETKEEAEKKKKKKKKSISTILTKIGNMGFLLKSVIYIAFVLIAAVYCSYFAITGINDVFAFVSTENEAKITVTESTTVDEIIDTLEAQGVIEYPWLFSLFCDFYGDGDEIKLLPGEYVIPDSLNFSGILSKLTTKTVERKIVRVTIPEGFTVDQIIDELVSKGIGTKEKYVDAINNYPYKHEFVQILDQEGYSEDRVYRLEGYLFPDTYDFYTDTAEYMVINRFLNNFQTRFWQYYAEDYKPDVDKLGLSFDDVITMASLVQMEAKWITDYETISYVFHNRLKNAGRFPYLESDATIQYFLDARKEDLTQDDLNADNPYNTYLYKGLTPGAICNPGLDAIEAAIYPSAPVNANGWEINAFFFVSDITGKTYYASTDAGHEANKKLAEEVNKQHNDNKN